MLKWFNYASKGSESGWNLRMMENVTNYFRSPKAFWIALKTAIVSRHKQFFLFHFHFHFHIEVMKFNDFNCLFSIRAKIRNYTFHQEIVEKQRLQLFESSMSITERTFHTYIDNSNEIYTGINPKKRIKTKTYPKIFALLC